MCTDRPDTTAALAIAGDNGSIGSGRAYNFTRSGTWGSPSSKATTIDVAKFIQGAALVNGAYFRRVSIGRVHSDVQSAAPEEAYIWITIGGAIPISGNENPDTVCRRWTPGGYSGANAYYGTTTINVKVKNMDPRFGSSGYGDWNDGTIYAMPTDEIGWIECYYGGTPATGNTYVSSINNGYKTYRDLRTDWCQSDAYGSVWNPGAFYPRTNVGSVPLAVSYYRLYAKSQQIAVWQNQFSIWGSGQVVRSGDSVAGGSFNILTKTTAARRNGYITSQGQAGQTFTEYGQTGGPQAVSIGSSNPSRSINRSFYQTVGSAKCGWVLNPTWLALGYYVPEWKCDGSIFGYEIIDHYNGHSCDNKYANTLWNANVTYSPHSDSASVQIPYNFETYTGVTLASDEVYSGETVKVSNVWTSVTARSNSVTKATYATQVPGAKLKLFAYVTSDVDNGNIAGRVTSNSNACSILGSAAKQGQCLELKSKSGFTLNGSGSLAGSYDEFGEMGGIYNAFDVAAGDLMCFVSAVYPASSGSDTQMGTGGDGNWRYSSPACSIIAKKPTFQVWGGSLYSVGGINTSIGAKNNIYNNYISNVSGRFNKTGGTTTYFGSWVEESLVLRDGITSSVASGAAIGLNPSITAGAGTTSSSFCNYWAPLSFANYSTTSGVACNGTASVGKSGINNVISNREELIDYWAGVSGGSATGGNASFNLGNPGSVGQAIQSATGKTVRYANYTGGITLSGTVPQNTTYLIKSGGTVTISGDIRYNTSNYNSLGAIPKVIIYAANVNIQCGVNEVDAIIVTRTDGRVDTCSNASGDVNDSARARQLKIFGMVIADGIDLKRTYGAAAWNHSRYGINTDAEAAEIFDYDSTIMMWSEYMAGSAETDTLQTVYQHELAPRY